MGEKTVTLVTGANGFLGAWIVRTLVARGHRVRAFVRAQSDRRNLDPVRDQIEFAVGDLLARETLDRALSGCDALIHTAGAILTHPRDGLRVWAQHYTGTVNTFAAARAAQIERIVYTASIFTLGAGTQKQPADETHGQPFTPSVFPYWHAKVEAQAHAQALDAPIVFVYPTFCFGPGDVNLSSAGELLDYLRGHLPLVTDTGINVIDVRDAALGHVLALERGRIGEKYLLAGVNTPLRDLFARAGQIAGHKRAPLVIPHRWMLPAGWFLEKILRHPPLDFATAQIAQVFWYYNGAKARRDLGLATRPLDETLRDAIAWFRAEKIL